MKLKFFILCGITVASILQIECSNKSEKSILTLEELKIEYKNVINNYYKINIDTCNRNKCPTDISADFWNRILFDYCDSILNDLFLRLDTATIIEFGIFHSGTHAQSKELLISILNQNNIRKSIRIKYYELNPIIKFPKCDEYRHLIKINSKSINIQRYITNIDFCASCLSDEEFISGLLINKKNSIYFATQSQNPENFIDEILNEID